MTQNPKGFEGLEAALKRQGLDEGLSFIHMTFKCCFESFEEATVAHKYIVQYILRYWTAAAAISLLLWVHFGGNGMNKLGNSMNKGELSKNCK